MQLTTIAKAVRLAVKASAVTLQAQAEEVLLNVRPLAMRAVGSVRLALKYDFNTLTHRVEHVRLANQVIKAVRLQVDARTDFDPIDLDQPAMVGAAMVGGFMLG